MLFFIIYKQTFDDLLFKLWLNHYKKMKVDFKIVMNNPDDLYFFSKSYPYSLDYIMNTIPSNTLEITEKDFLFSYTKDEHDNMILIYNLDTNFVNETICIGKIFHVPIENKPIYSTFEIPDFILYNHKDHTNYTVDGIKIKGGEKISTSIICLNMNNSKLILTENEYYKKEYYENIVLYMGPNDPHYILGINRYIEYAMNIIVNKEKKYGLIWHSKCGCSTISNIFCSINNITNVEKKNQRSLNFIKQHHRYNIYLQNIHLICFVRNPYHRFLSTYIDKHVYQTDDIYLTLDGYLQYNKIYKKDNIYNLCNFISNNGLISRHYQPIIVNNYIEKLNYKTLKVENGLNKQLYTFLEKYHDNLYLFREVIHNCFENATMKIENETTNNTFNNDIHNTFFVFYNKDDWLYYLNKNNINYDDILQNNIFLKNTLYQLYLNDFIKFNYNK